MCEGAFGKGGYFCGVLLSFCKIYKPSANQFVLLSRNLLLGSGLLKRESTYTKDKYI